MGPKGAVEVVAEADTGATITVFKGGMLEDLPWMRLEKANLLIAVTMVIPSLVMERQNQIFREIQEHTKNMCILAKQQQPTTCQEERVLRWE